MLLLRNFPFVQWVPILIFTVVLIYQRLEIAELKEKCLRMQHNLYACMWYLIALYPRRNNTNNSFVLPDDAVQNVEVRSDTGKNGIRAEARNNDALEDMVVIYNRVPKTASTSFVGLVYDLCKQNKYHVLHINVTNNMHTLTLANQVTYV